MIGQTCNCDRCGAKCQVGTSEVSKAKILRRSAHPRGFCNNCAVTEFLANTYPPNMIIEESQHGPAILLFPHIQEQFARLMEGRSDMTPEEINWQTVVDNWDLPLKVKHSPMNPHLPGNSVTRNLAKRQVRDESLFSMMKTYVEEKQGYKEMSTNLSYIPEEDDGTGGYIC